VRLALGLGAAMTGGGEALSFVAERLRGVEDSLSASGAGRFPCLCSCESVEK
jgi:hypothetical protein